MTRIYLIITVIIFWGNVSAQEADSSLYYISNNTLIFDNGMHNAFPSALVTETKRILVGYRASTGHLDSFAMAAMIFSDDSGATWSNPIIIDDGSDFDTSKYGIRNVHFNQIKNSKLLATYHVNDGNYGGLYYKISKDNGDSWGKRKQIKVRNYTPNKISCEAHIIEIENKFILPVFSGDRNDSLKAGFLVSKNLRSWKHQILPEQNGKSVETTATLSKSGALFAFYTDPTNKKLYKSISENQGDTWSDPKDITFYQWRLHRSNVYINDAENEMLLIYRKTWKQRGALALSKDNGNTWSFQCYLNNDLRRIVYGDFIFINNRLLVIYATEENSNGNNASLYMVEINRR